MSSPARRSLTILAVEDNILLRTAVVSEFEDVGFRVIEAGEGRDAFRALEEHAEIDVLFTDIRLPGEVDGWEIARRFRELHPDRPIIYASAYAPGAERRVSDSLFFPKPYRPSQIIRAIERLAGGPD
ncbi:MAG TPA: response regulator [Salinarimonas sp.]|jgi:CheY-like chemotaxis protein|nr:response regulator [Salinarimonas sp.]